MSAVPLAETMSLWSEEECRAFELGERDYPCSGPDAW